MGGEVTVGCFSWSDNAESCSATVDLLLVLSVTTDETDCLNGLES